MTLFRTDRLRSRVALIAFVILWGVCEGVGQELQIGIIDFFGLHQVSLAQVREALTFKEGDSISVDGGPPMFLVESEKRLSELPGVVRAQASLTCCDQGQAIIYVSIEEHGAVTMHFRASPQGSARLAVIAPRSRIIRPSRTSAPPAARTIVASVVSNWRPKPAPVAAP